jgi:hypothetical protein
MYKMYMLVRIKHLSAKQLKKKGGGDGGVLPQRENKVVRRSKIR